MVKAYSVIESIEEKKWFEFSYFLSVGEVEVTSSLQVFESQKCILDLWQTDKSNNNNNNSVNNNNNRKKGLKVLGSYFVYQFQI